MLSKRNALHKDTGTLKTNIWKKIYIMLTLIKRKLEQLSEFQAEQYLEQGKLSGTKTDIMIKGSIPQEDTAIHNVMFSITEHQNI